MNFPVFGQLDETRGCSLLFYVLDTEPPMTNQKWTRYFENSKNGECHSEVLKFSHLLAVPSHRANQKLVSHCRKSSGQWRVT
jgi:hypothetical protein